MTKQILGYTALVLLLGCIGLEFYAYIELRPQDTGIYHTPTLFLIASMGIFLSSLYLAFRPLQVDNWLRYTVPCWGRHAIYWTAFAVLTFILFSKLVAFFDEYEITPDIVPALQYYARRLLAGEKVYAPMPFETWTVIPNYLPLMWLPYIIPELLQIDYRFLPFALTVIAIGFWAYHLLRQQVPLAGLIFATLIPFYLFFQMIEKVPNDLAHNAEFTPIAFYLFLALAIWRKSRTWMIITITLCLLSRIAFSFWLPMFFVILWIEKGFSYPFKMGLYLLAGIFFIYVLPFVIPDPDSFLAGASYYEKVASDIWTQPWHAREGIPVVLQEGTSFAYYFFEQNSDQPALGLVAAEKFHFWGSLITAVFLFGIYLLVRKKINFYLYGIISLKFYLAIFYLLMHTPFAYLYQLPIFMSFPILWALLKGGTVNQLK